MTKEQLKEKTLDVLQNQHEQMLRYMNAVIEDMGEDDIELWENNYFMPKAFLEALNYMTTDHVTERSYSISYARTYKNAVRSFKKEIVNNKSY